MEVAEREEEDLLETEALVGPRYLLDFDVEA
jgi:hypothetical protein